MFGRFLKRFSRHGVVESILARLRTPKGNAFAFNTLTEAEQRVARELAKRGLVIFDGDPHSTSLDVSVRLLD